MLIAVPKEILSGENRVALIPAGISALTKAGMEVLVETGAGAGCFYADQAYEDAGAKIAPNAAALYEAADILFKVRPPESEEVEQLRAGTTLICLMDAFSESTCSINWPPIKSADSVWSLCRASAAHRAWMS